MVSRLTLLFMVLAHLLLFASGCEQVKEQRKRAYYEKALRLYEMQDYIAARKQVNLALAFDADYLDALILSGKCEYELKNYEIAGKKFGDAVLLGGVDREVVLLAADAWVMRGRYPRAIALTNNLLAEQPGNVDALYANVRARLRSETLRHWAEVGSMLQPLLDDDVYRERAYALLAHFRILNMELEAAESILMKHVDSNADWLFVARRLAAKFDRLGDYESAARVYRKIVKQKPSSVQDKDSLLVLMRKYRRKADERKYIEMLLSGNPQLRYKLLLVDFYVFYEMFDEAEKRIRDALKTEEGYVQFSRYMIEIYEKTGRYDDAISFIKDVLKRVVDDVILQVEFMNALAEFYYKKGRPELAMHVVRWIRDLDINNHKARFLFARIALDEGRTLLAIAELRALGSEDTENPEYDYYTGLAHMARKETSNAEQALKDALIKDPFYKPALLKLVEIYFEKERLVDIDRMVNEFLEHSPHDIELLAVKDKLVHKLSLEPAGG